MHTSVFSAGLAIWLLLACQPSLRAQSQSPARPNIVIIMADDMGYSDLGCYGGEIETPHLDSLAKGGLRFTQFYNTGRCCPTRAALLTGVYPHQAGIGHMMEDRGSDGYRGELSRARKTIAEALKPVGYRSYLAGKWHVTQKINPGAGTDISNWPLQRGFDRFYGTIHGAGSFFDPNSLVRDNTLVSPYADPEYRPESFYYTDAIADHASRFVVEHSRDAPKAPFFLYVAFTAPHWPLHAKPADMAKHRGRYDAGYDAIRAARQEKMRAVGLLDPRWNLATPNAAKWGAVENKAFEIRCMEVYAAMVDSMDQGVGRLLTALKSSGQWDNTLVFFLQDNGACAEPMGRKGPFRARPEAPPLPPMDPGALQMQMIPAQTRDGYPTRRGYGVLPGAADTYHGYGEAWANVSNTPFREYKHWVHEGGISTPLVAHWPKGIPASRHDQIEHQPGHLIDLMATCLDVAGIAAGEQEIEGVSLRPAFSGGALNRGRPLYFEHEGNRAVRDGRWKLVAKGPEGAWELYDLEADRTETTNLALSKPDLTAKMVRQWERWAVQTGVLPWPWKPAYELTAPRSNNTR
jgi:arylsulfatase